MFFKKKPKPENLVLNVGDQFIFALDISGSMDTRDCPGNMTRIEFAKKQALIFAREADKYDPDGADYYTFGTKVTGYLNQTEAEAKKIIWEMKANGGSTATADVIQAAWNRSEQLRADGCEDNIVLMVITDGEPNDQEAVKSIIRSIADTLDNGEEFGIIFLTVGQISPGLKRFLTDLDDNLKAKHDIVDVKDFMSVNFEQAFAGAIHD